MAHACLRILGSSPRPPRATGQVGISLGKLLGEQRCTGAPASPTKHVQDSADPRFSFANDGSCGSGSMLCVGSTSSSAPDPSPQRSHAAAEGLASKPRPPESHRFAENAAAHATSAVCCLASLRASLRRAEPLPSLTEPWPPRPLSLRLSRLPEFCEGAHMRGARAYGDRSAPLRPVCGAKTKSGAQASSVPAFCASWSRARRRACRQSPHPPLPAPRGRSARPTPPHLSRRPQSPLPRQDSSWRCGRGHASVGPCSPYRVAR